MPINIPTNAQPWQYNLDASGAATNTAALAAVVGKRVWVTHIVFNTAPGGTLKIMDASAGTVMFGTVTLAANGNLVVDRSANPLLIGHGKGVFITTTGAGVACVNLAGFWA